MIDLLRKFSSKIDQICTAILNVQRHSVRHDALHDQIAERVLGQCLTDDERAELLGLPNGCRIRENAKIISREKLILGESVWIGDNAIVDASGGLEIGAHVTIGCGVYVWSHHSVLSSLLMSNQIGSPYIVRKPTIIGEGCFIGGPSVINAGVSIGARSLVLPMAVVTKDIPPKSIVAGAPGVVIGEVDDDYINKLKSDLVSC